MADSISPVTGITNPPAGQTAEDYGYYTKLTISEYKRNSVSAESSPFKLATTEPKLILMLPIPSELRDDTTVGYTNVNLETVGDLVNGRGMGIINSAALRSVGGVVGAGLDSLSKTFKNMGDIGGGIASGFVNIAKSLFPAEQITSAVQQSYGAAPNPNPSVQFQGPVLRDFALSWAFYPKNADESSKINDMVKRLKGFALPSDNKSNSGAILNYPHVCQLNFYPWDGGGRGDNGWSDNSIIRIKKCFMAGINVNYNAYGTPAFFEGTKLPVTYQLTINFKEIEYLLANDWYAGADTSNSANFDTVSALGILRDTATNLYNKAEQTGQALYDALPDIFTTSPPELTPEEQKVADQEAIKALGDSFLGFRAGQGEFDPITQIAADGTKFETFTAGTGSTLRWFVRETDKNGNVILPDDADSTEQSKNARSFETDAEAIQFLDSRNAWGPAPAPAQ